ncbi:MAG TPA: PAS domain-containing protein, partial [Bradyrhizobium sp.]|nr:PAS domain-containing protein [Bradyrhizobium sp.]
MEATMLDAGNAAQVDESTSSGDGARHIASIAPHAHQMLLISKTADLKQSEASALADTLNGLAAGIFLVDAGRRIVHVNTAGHDILRADDFLRSISGQLVARNTQANRTLDEVF